MNEREIKEAQLQAVRDLKKQGVYGIKLELEGTLQRRNTSASTERCGTCSGNGSSECPTCEGIGWRVDADGYETDDECTTCESTGRQNCSACHGAGRIAKDGFIDLSQDPVAFKNFMDRVAKKTGTKLARLSGASKVNPFPWMSFAKLYYDGSVDTEVTFTVRLDNEENIFHIPKVLEAFREMAEAHGQGLDVRGAGMHTALIFDRDCSYPTSSFPYTGTQTGNFRRAVTQLLPALYFLATATSRSRGIGRFRPPTVGGSGKHTAIGYNGGAMEFRIFDTCYERPAAALDNIVVLRNLMKFMSTKYISPGVGEALKKSTITFGNDNDQTLGRLYITADQIGALYAGLPKIMPEYYTIEQLKEQREFDRSLEDAAEIERQQREQAEAEFAEYEERYNWQIKAREQEYRGQIMREIVKDTPIAKLRTLTQEEIEEMCSKKLKSALSSYVRQKKTAERYIEERMARLNKVGRGDFYVELA